MGLLMPSKKILEAIGFNEASHCRWTEIPTKGFTRYAIWEGATSHLMGYIHSINEFYGVWMELAFSTDFLHNNHCLLVKECLKNTWMHGSRVPREGDEIAVNGTPYSHGIFFGSKGLCSGFQDKGGYFKDPDIKKWYEEETSKL